MVKLSAEDRLDIQDVANTYAFYCDTAQYEKVPDLFTADAIFDETIIGVPLASGIEAIRATFEATNPAQILYFIHFQPNVWVREASDDEAKVVVYLDAQGALSNGATPHIRGYYDDIYKKIDGRWFIKRRTIVAFAPPVGWDWRTT